MFFPLYYGIAILWQTEIIKWWEQIILQVLHITLPQTIVVCTVHSYILVLHCQHKGDNCLWVSWVLNCEHISIIKSVKVFPLITDLVVLSPYFSIVVQDSVWYIFTSNMFVTKSLESVYFRPTCNFQYIWNHNTQFKHCWWWCAPKTVRCETGHSCS